MEERKFVCKYCNKKFPCGKSLGGHIRTHMNEHSAQNHNEEKRNADRIKFDASRKRKKDLGSEAAAAAAAAADAGNYIYGLRENPKKTMRFVHSNTGTLHQEKFCKECGKGFPSLKALCGHMACHSEKEKGSSKLESNSGFGEKQKLIMDSQSDTETSAPTNQRRSKRTRVKTLNNHPSPGPLGNGSSSVSEVEQEQEEVARCLMLLSKDSSYRGRFAMLTDSSDNNSVVLEAKSPSVDTRITVNNGKNSVSSAYELVEKKVTKEMKLKSAEIAVSDNSDSGYFRYGPRNFGSDVSVDGFFKNRNLHEPKVERGSEFVEPYCAETAKILNKCRNRNTASRKLELGDVEYDERDGAKRKFNSKNVSFNHNSTAVSCKKTANESLKEEIYENGGKEWMRYECLSSERVNGSYDSAYESDENSTDTDSYPAVKLHGSKAALNQKKTSIAKKKLMSKKSRGHECPVCHKIFKSGQALGGHKRSHFVGSSEENTLVIKQGPAAVPCLIDLNLPAPVDE
ncbi:hypothetical protein L6164_020874 [Bauhinia variegata]|uniref:Uncharacterized protein n=1 Tax=Bauhinia variegata TaxID=167791 RepID=A0ACB9MXX8_BAUVA|nr:hypothetical protein L6164_020874 [Bauhinia variegata]